MRAFGYSIQQLAPERGDLLEGRHPEVVGPCTFLGIKGGRACILNDQGKMVLVGLHERGFYSRKVRRRRHGLRSSKAWRGFDKDWLGGPTWPFWFEDVQPRPNRTDIRRPTWHKTGGRDHLAKFVPISIGIKKHGLRWLSRHGLAHFHKLEGENVVFFSIDKQFQLPAKEIRANWDAKRHK